MLKFAPLPLNIHIRFFVVDYDMEEPDIRECTEQEFIAYGGEITYKKHTMFTNGCDQVCLTADCHLFG